MTVSLQGMSRQEKLALLARLRAEGGAGAAPGPAVATDLAGPGRFPLSFAQRRLWFLDRLEPGSSSEVIFRAVRLRGPFDPAALAAAVERLVARHGSLRTRFVLDGDEPVQVVEAAGDTEPALARTDLSALAADEAEAALARLAREEAERPFDLGRAPLLRVRLVSLAADHHALLVAVHHIVADGWSLGLFFGELSELYGAAFDRREPSLPAPGAVYGELAADQRRRLDGEGLGRQLEAWRVALDGAPQVLDLPTDRPRPALASFRGATVPVALSAETSSAVEALARAERATPFMVLLAAFAVVLGRWARQRDLLLGVPIAGRDDPRSERVVGLFANTLVIRVELDGDRTGSGEAGSFRALVGRVRRRTLDALGRQETPFEHLVEELVPERDLSRNPLFQAMFALQTMAPTTLELGPATIEPLAVERSLAKVDLTLDLARRDGGFRGVLEHNTDLFDRATAERLAGQVVRLAGELAAEPDRALETFDLPGAAERAELLRLAQGPPGPKDREEAGSVAKEGTVDALFRRRAAAAPDRPAVEAEGVSWTYGALRRAARRVAEVLAGRGVRAEERVGVLASRSPEAIAAFLGVLEAGGAYVPLDPEYPAERLAFMLADSGARLLLAAGGDPSAVGDLTEVETVPLSRDDLFAPGPMPGPEPLRPAPPEAAAYVLYTSGTTGRPKGVVVPHRALAGHCRGILESYELSADDRVYQFAALSFDIAGEEIYPSLAAGATLHLRPEGVTPSPAELAGRIGEQAISVVNVPTPLWHEWAGETAVGRALPAPSLRLVVVGTEGALPERLATWRESLGGLDRPPRWVNAYGPTEGTITATVWSPGPGTPLDLPRVPIGRPLAGVRALVLDPAGRLAGLGVPGELHLGGRNLARGYLGRPAATARAFVPDPTAATPGARLYATGDLVRLRPDGQIEFLGRTDDQVKVRGFRIEPAEVEATLARHPAVGDAAVVPVEAGPGDIRLVAYVAGERGAEPVADELAAFLAEHLPAYMVPAAFVMLAELPLTPAGKVDRRSLPAPDWSAVGPHRYQAPRGLLEELVASVWSEVLGVETVGARDDFFRLGGHSLLAARVVARLRDRLGVEVPLRRLFEAPTVEGLARVVAGLRRGDTPTLPPLARRPVGASVPASFAQQRLWFLDRLEPGSVLYNMPALVVLEPPTGEGLDPVLLARALGEIVRRHESLRTRLVESRATGSRGEVPLQEIDPPVDPRRFPLPVVDLSALAPDVAAAAARAAALAEARTPFDLAVGPLARFRLLRLPAREHRLLFTAHHAVSDGWSTDLVLSELTGFYDAFAAGRPSPYAELAVQVGDVALWERAWLDGPALGALAEHWRHALAGAPRVVELPTDRPRPPVPSGRGARVPLAFPAQLSEGVMELARRLGATPFMVLATAWAAVVGRWSGAADLLLGTPVAGRSRSEMEPLVGLFANTLVLRADLSGAPSFADAVRRLREASLDAYAHDDLPFERLVEELAPERDLSHHPLFQVFFAHHGDTADTGAPEGADAPAGLRASLAANDNRTARFDLALNLWRHDGRIRGFLELATDLFDPATGHRMGQHLEVLLAAAVAAPETPVPALPLAGPAELRTVLDGWNRAGEADPDDDATGATVDTLFRARAAERPDAVALVVGDDTWTFGELAARSAALGARLAELGVGPEDRVALHFERSAEMVVAVLGVLAAGAAYVPLDPAYPAERLAAMARASRPAVVLTGGALDPAVREAAGSARVVPLTDARELDGSAGRSAGGGAGPDSLAYVLYTSGSTGVPKGVQVAHRSLVRFLRAMAEEPGFGADDSLVAVTTLSFDIAGLELFLPLVTGGRVVLADRWTAASPEKLAALLDAVAPTVMQATPVTWRMLVAGGWQAPPPTKLLCGGEALPRELAERLVGPGRELWNMYGPTETTIWSSVHRVSSGDGPVPVGAPIGGTAFFVVDPTLRPVPLGVAGELAIGGAGLARGYRQRPGATAERFVPDPWSGRSGARLYRTGDLVRLRPDGTVAFLGRLDHQVKVRGFRIELGEIESVLGDHPAVAEAVVAVREDGAGDAQLVAYVTGPEDVPAADLRAHLEARLPAYMVPGLFVHLAELPLTPNGKVDRKALPAPAPGTGDAAPKTPPRTTHEAVLAEIWAQVLGHPELGVHDDFFALGGHSLKATRVINLIAERTGLEVPLRALFDDRTIARLGERLDELDLERLDADALADALDEIDDLSDEELAALLADDETDEGKA